MVDLRKELAVFGFSNLQNLVVLFDILESREITIEQVRKFVDSEIALIKVQEENREKLRNEWIKIAKRCPNCGGPLYLKEIAIPKGRKNVYGYRSLWFCSNDNCIYEKYNMEEVKNIVKGLKDREGE